MVIDTSALVAILTAEADARRLIETLDSTESRLLSAANLVEVSIVIESRFGPEGVRDLDLFLARADIEIVPVDAEQATVARHAYSRFGKGRHPANLNYGDCFAYALAITRNEPLLFKGEDFAQTDVGTVPPGTVVRD
jgi:ribonuclease VapC